MPSTTSPLGFPYPNTTVDPPNVPADIQALATAVQTYLMGPAWITLPLATGVSGVAGAGTSAGPYVPQYRIWLNGRVEYRGSVQRSDSSAFGSNPTLFSIPSGAVPTSIVRLSVPGNVASGVTVNPRIEFTPADGLCKLWSNAGDYTFLSLDGYFYDLA